MYDNNSTPFFYEICSLWQTQNMTQKNFQCFFVFGNNQDERYFKVPSLSFKIKTKSDFDNTEVKMFCTYETLPDLINIMKDYLFDDQNKMIQLAGHKYTFYVSEYPTQENERYVTLKLTNADSITNDFIMRRSVLEFIVKTLEKTYDNIIALSLDFIKIAQNNNILETMHDIQVSLKDLKVTAADTVNVISNQHVPCKPPPTEIPLTQAQPTPINNIPSPVPMIQPPITNMKKELPPIDMKEFGKDVDAFEQENLSIEGLGESVDTSPIDNINIELSNTIDENDIDNSNENNVQNEILSYVKNEIGKDPSSRLKGKILKVLESAYAKQVSTYEMLSKIFEETSLISGIPLSFIDVSKYMYLSYSSYCRYFKQLAYVTDLHKNITTKVPLFLLKVKFEKQYIEKTELLNSTLVDLYVEYRTMENKDDTQEFIYACLRYALAPLWSSYISVSAKYDTHENKFLGQLRQLTFARLQTWVNDWNNILDTFIYENQLAFNYKDEPVETLFSYRCPTIYHCFTSMEDASMENVNMVKDIITQLEETLVFEHVNLKDRNFEVLSDEFLITLKTFSKVYDIKKTTTKKEIEEIYAKVYNEIDVKNIRNEFKALKALDTCNQQLEKNEGATK